MQDIQRVPHNDVPMDVYSRTMDVPSYFLDVHPEAMYNYPESQQGEKHYKELDAMASSNHRVTLDHRGEALTATTNEFEFSGKPPAISLSESITAQPLVSFPERSASNSSVLSNNRKGLQARVNSTSKPAMINSQDLASTLASDIAARLGLSSSKESQFKTKEDVEKAIQRSVIDLLGSRPTQPKNSRASPSTDAADTEKRFKCEYCSKKKKSQCDLTYIS